jgi:hypothetical protein
MNFDRQEMKDVSPIRPNMTEEAVNLRDSMQREEQSSLFAMLETKNRN